MKTIEESFYYAKLQGTNIPGRMRGGIIRYLVYGIIPGDFLKAIITNDLAGAFRTADSENKGLIEEYVKWFYNEAPSQSWGSLQRALTWSTDRIDGLRQPESQAKEEV